ncbi:MAG TPA: YfhO family protein [Streptosporangiaceae bacterium]|nr:YfhO family protein [Streptosporangiaceae bacterium]
MTERTEGQRPGVWAWPSAAVSATVAWSLWELRSTLQPAQYLDDSSVHEQMVRFATSQLSAGHDPLTSWFPYLGLGSPQFLHYQSTPAILTGLAGLVIGPDAAYRWSLYLLWCLWPVAIYASARLFRLRPWAAALAAVVAPLLHSVPGIGYEQHAYLWIGYGVWTQLWASWGLPFAWALTWRACEDKRFLAPAAALVALTSALHYETGYLAFSAVVILPFLVRRDLRARLVRGAVLLGASLLASAWVVFPLLRYSHWAGVNQALEGTPLENGYGARLVMGWLLTGRVFDYGHLPVITLLVLAGMVTAVVRWRAADAGRALLALFCLGLLLSFGRTTFGNLVSIIPGSTDLFFRRFLMGAQLAGIYLAGIGAATVAERVVRWAEAGARSLGRHRLGWLDWLPITVAALAGVGFLFPAWQFFDSYDALNSADIGIQTLSQTDEPQVATAVAYIQRHGGGRVYAGAPTSWGTTFTVGYVPAFKYIESMDVDEVGYTLRTASLMTQPEYHFSPQNPGDYAVFGIRYMIVPRWVKPPPGAVRVLRLNQIGLYEYPANSYFRVADTVGTVTANREDLGSQTIYYLQSALPGEGRYPTVAFAGAPAAPPTLAASAHPSGTPGVVMHEHTDLAQGSASAAVSMRRRAAVVLSASYDPGWTVTVDGRPAQTEMVGPALVAVTVPAGTHTIAFQYHGFGAYPGLIALAVVDLLALDLVTRKRGWPLAGQREVLPASADRVHT